MSAFWAQSGPQHFPVILLMSLVTCGHGSRQCRLAQSVCPHSEFILGRGIFRVNFRTKWTCISTAQAHTKRVSAFCIQSGPQHLSRKFQYEMVILMSFVTCGHALRLHKFAETVQCDIVIGARPGYCIFLLLLFLLRRIAILNIIFYFSRGIIILNILLSTSSSSTTSPYISSPSTSSSSTSSSSSSTSSF